MIRVEPWIRAMGLGIRGVIMDAVQAKKIIEAKLNALGLSYAKLTARKVGFQDLARGDCVFVKVHGWKPDPLWDVLVKLAKANGFRVEAASR